jgi:inhibitor of cysteine peptidase
MRKKTVFYGILVMALTMSGAFFSIAANQTEPGGGDVFLYTGSPLILSQGEVKMLDAANPDIGATVIQSRALVPLRALSEYFGAEVNYDQNKKEAAIQYDGKKYIFPIGEKKYFLDRGIGKTEYAMDSQSVVLDGRTMVPLRVFCENVLGRTVSYYNRVIAVSDHAIDLKSDTKLIGKVQGKIGEAVKASSKVELQRVLAAGASTPQYIQNDAKEMMTDGVNTKTKAEAASGSSSENSSYSTTNVQVDGIDEADIVKTDGKYIYIGGNNVVRIVGADNGKLSDATAIRLASNKNVNEIYVADGKLVILGTKWDGSYKNITDPQPLTEEKAVALSAANKMIYPPYYNQKSFSFIDVYDISNPSRPLYLKGHEMEGSYQSSRKNGDIVYMVTNTSMGGDVLPLMRDSVSGNKESELKLGDVMIMPRHPSSGYIIVSAMNITDGEKTEVEAITAYGSIMYMNDSSLYLAVNDNESTSIIKFRLAGLKVGYAGSGKVKGYLLNQFSMDEYKGNLRVATTIWESGNGISILDDSMNQIGSVDGLAKGETIYSVRFIGDKGYIVTYRTVDPLFVFDLSDPQKPAVTGELKIPGFSNYLHPIGKDLILGIGADTYDIYRKDENGKDVVVGTRQGGIKFSLFDISDAGKPKEISKLVLGDSGSGAEAMYNHKAIMVDQTSERVAFDASLNYEDQKKPYQQGALIVGYEGNRLNLKGLLNSEPSGNYGNDIPYARRVLYIGEQLYYVQDGRVTSYDYDSLKKIDDLVLQ